MGNLYVEVIWMELDGDMMWNLRESKLVKEIDGAGG
jgi:hypothetical protein